MSDVVTRHSAQKKTSSFSAKYATNAKGAKKEHEDNLGDLGVLRVLGVEKFRAFLQSIVTRRLSLVACFD
ncbi:MAG TPA: hypothetical protein VEK08_02020 [Planctomycetota bacterium]|nr:hypothetical protein [Planctomycetota bacterium]